MTIRGRIRNGGVVLDEPAALPDGTAVEVRTVPPTDAVAADASARPPGPTLYDRYERFIGAAPGLPGDFAAEHDHYIHGTPKRKAP